MGVPAPGLFKKNMLGCSNISLRKTKSIFRIIKFETAACKIFMKPPPSAGAISRRRELRRINRNQPKTLVLYLNYEIPKSHHEGFL